MTQEEKMRTLKTLSDLIKKEVDYDIRKMAKSKAIEIIKSICVQPAQSNDKNKAYRLNKDLVIPAGTIFENWSIEQKEGKYFSAVWGNQVHDNFAGFFKISYSEMEEILKWNPDFFHESNRP